MSIKLLYLILFLQIFKSILTETQLKEITIYHKQASKKHINKQEVEVRLQIQTQKLLKYQEFRKRNSKKK